MFSAFSKAVKGLHSRGDGFRNGHRLFGARKWDFSHERVVKGAIRGCNGDPHFLKKSEKIVRESGAVADEVLHLFRVQVCAKAEKTGAELNVKRSLV